MNLQINKETIFHKIFDHISDGLYFVDKDRKITYWNQSAEKISGYTEAEMKDCYCFDDKLNHIDEYGNKLCLNKCPLAFTIEDGNSRQATVYLHHKQGHRIPVSVTIEPVYDEQRNIVGAVEIFQNKSSQLDIQQRIESLEKRVFEDSLTGIANRAALQHHLETMFARFNRYAMSFGVILYDIDHFKHVNDQYGHNVGDKVIQMVANTLHKNTRTSDIMGRWGGEEFLCIVPNVNQDEIYCIAERFRNLVEQSETTFNQETIQVTISAGCAIVQYDDTINELLNRADVNLYMSKQKGRNQVTA